jgi:subtilisin family serine protease
LILAVKYSGDVASVKRAIDFVIAVSKKVNVRVVNCSFGFQPGNNSCDSQILRAAFDKLNREKNLLVVASSGNADVAADPRNPHYPSDYDFVLAVTATDCYDNHFHSRYSTSAGNLIGAPGAAIYTTQSAGYGDKEGSSFAAGFVSGAAALVLSETRDNCDKLMGSQLRALLLNSSDKNVGNLQRFIMDGRRLNVLQAITHCH